MKKYWLRSLIFNVAFYSVTIVLSIAYAPLLFLNEKQFGKLIRVWLRIVMVLEYSILGLKLKVIGRENLPKEGSYIIAAKHQSAYETLKLHLLFPNAAVILKRELLWIPLFGSYLKKSGAIAINRATPETAHESIREGALRVMQEGRPIVIFPQGTRVAVGVTPEQKPYKVGIARLQETTGLPIIPVAMNSGVFWSRNSPFKRPGTVTFEIMESISAGKERQELMKELEDKIEAGSNRLVAEAQIPVIKSKKQKTASWAIKITIIICLFGCYALWWKMVEFRVRNAYSDMHPPYVTAIIKITGFPGKMKIFTPEEKIETPDGSLMIHNLEISGFPLPFAMIKVTASDYTVNMPRWRRPLTFTNAEAHLYYWNGTVTVDDSVVSHENFRAAAYGTIKFIDPNLPVFDMTLKFINHQEFIRELAMLRVIDHQAAFMAEAGFNAMMDPDGIVYIPITQQGRTLYAGPFAFAEIPEPRQPISDPLSEATDILPAPSP